MTISIGAIYNYGGDNYKVTRHEPNKFLCMATDEEWVDAVAFTDHVKDGETATIEYVMGAEDFEDNYSPGETEEGASAEQQPAGEQPEASQLPADQLPPSAKQQPAPGGYEKVKPGEPNQPEAQPKKY